MPSQFSGQSQFAPAVPMMLGTQFGGPARGAQQMQMDAAMLERLRRQQEFERQQQLRLQLLRTFQGL